MGFSKTKFVPHTLLRISIFGFQVDFTMTLPEIFHLFTLTIPGNVRFFLKLWHTPWNSNDFYSTHLPMEFSIDILDSTGGVTDLF